MCLSTKDKLAELGIYSLAVRALQCSATSVIGDWDSKSLGYHQNSGCWFVDSTDSRSSSRTSSSKEVNLKDALLGQLIPQTKEEIISQRENWGILS